MAVNRSVSVQGNAPDEAARLKWTGFQLRPKFFCVNWLLAEPKGACLDLYANRNRDVYKIIL